MADFMSMNQEPDNGYDAIANELGLDQQEDDTTPTSSSWTHLEGQDIGPAIIDRATRFREWQAANGLLQGWRLKLHYYHDEYRTNTEIPHLSIMQQWGAQGEYQFVPLNHLRSLLKTVLSSVVQNPPNFQPRAINADANAMEAAALYQGVLDYYSRELKLPQKINKAVETGMVVDQGFMLVEWDAFAGDADTNLADPTIWKGAPSAKILGPWDVTYDPTKDSWGDLDWVIVRDWVDKEKVKAQFPEFASDIEGCRLKGEVIQGNTMYEGNTRYELSSFSDISNDIQVFKFFHRSTPWMPEGRFVMCLESGKVIFESPVGLVYPKIPVERFVPDEQIDALLGYSPINEMLAPQESINALNSAITTNANNHANQYVAVQSGTELNPRTLADGQKIIEYPAGTNPPQGLNLTAIPPVLIEHMSNVMRYMQEIPGVSNASRGQAPGANSTGSAMLFLSSQTTANQGSMSDHYAQFCANVMTSLLHVLRVFARTQKTINIMGKTVASKTIVLAEALKDFDEVVVDLTNPILSTPQGKMAFAQQMMQYGNATPVQALQVATSGNLGPATDPAREEEYELELENQWLLDGESVLVNALDNHEQHVMMHKQLFSTPWLRKPDLAEKLGITNAPQIMQTIMQHIQEHMQYLSQNQTGSVATTAGQTPGQPEQRPSPALGHMPSQQQPQGGTAAQHGQATAMQIGSHMPNMPSAPMQPR